MSARCIATAYILVDDLGQFTVDDDSSGIWERHEHKGGYSALQLYELKIDLPRAGPCVVLTSRLDVIPAKPTEPVTISVAALPE